MSSRQDSTRLVATLLLTVLGGCSYVSGIVPRKAPPAEVSAARMAQIGLLFESQGATEKAIETYDRALAQDPSSELLSRRIAKLRSVATEEPVEPRAMTVAEVFGEYEQDQGRLAASKTKTSSLASKHLQAVSHRQVGATVDDSDLLGRQTLIPTEAPMSGESSIQ